MLPPHPYLTLFSHHLTHHLPSPGNASNESNAVFLTFSTDSLYRYILFFLLPQLPKKKKYSNTSTLRWQRNRQRNGNAVAFSLLPPFCVYVHFSKFPTCYVRNNQYCTYITTPCYVHNNFSPHLNLLCTYTPISSQNCYVRNLTLLCTYAIMCYVRTPHPVMYVTTSIYGGSP